MTGLGITLVVLDRRGDYTAISLGELGAGRHAPNVRVPQPARGGRLVALRLSYPVIAAFAAGHRDSGTSLAVSDASVGTLQLGRLDTGRALLAPLTDWIGAGGVHVKDGRVHYVLNRAADSVLRPQEPLEGFEVPVLASPELARAAGAGGVLPLHVETQVLQARVVGAVNAVSVDGRRRRRRRPAQLARGGKHDQPRHRDRKRGLARRLGFCCDAARARSVFGSRRWLAAGNARCRARRSPARGTLALLLVAAAVGLALSAVGVVLMLLGDLRDESGELFDLEAQGATPADLRRHLLLRAGLVSLVGLLGGVGAGAAVGELVVGVVTVTAGAATPVPPLVLVFDWPVVAAALAGLATVATVGGLGVTRLARARRQVGFSEGVE